MKNRLLAILTITCLSLVRSASAADVLGPFDRQVADNVRRLGDENPMARARAAESLGFMRAYSAESSLIGRLGDPAAEVRRQAAMALAWCGGRKAVPALLVALDDGDWVVRQAAHVSLTNLTGMEFPFDALAGPSLRDAQAKAWRDWWAGVPADRPPREVRELLESAARTPAGRSATVSSAYKGTPDVLVDGQIGPDFWQTKLVDFPQWCLIDLGRKIPVDRVIVHQYGPGFCMTDYELAASLDGKQYDVVRREKRSTPVTLSIDFPAREARYVRLTSFNTERPTYPTTLFEVEVLSPGETALSTQTSKPANDLTAWRLERAVRALGALGGQGAAQAILGVLGDNPSSAPARRPMVRAAIRSLGRLREEVGFQYLVKLLDNLQWARNAADALGEFGDRRAVPVLLAAYPRYAKLLDGQNPPDVPGDDRMGFPSEDRMLETPYAIAYALCRLSLHAPADRKALHKIAPRIMANLPGDHDTFFLYQPEVGHLLTRHLMEHSGLRQEACEQAMKICGQPRRVPAPEESIVWSKFPPRLASSWLPAVCTDAVQGRLGAAQRGQGVGLPGRPPRDRAVGQASGRGESGGRLRLQRHVQGRGVQRPGPAMARGIATGIGTAQGP
jgi:HEAT repeat protein